jgi:site-specific recombinase XerD
MGLRVFLFNLQLRLFLKNTNTTCGLGVKNISTHSLRKSFGKHVYESNQCSDRILTLLSEISYHSKVAITRKYIGLVEEDIIDVYVSL